MVSFSRYLVAVLSYAALTIAAVPKPQAPTSPQNYNHILPPSEDKFYRIPKDIASYKPGEIIRHRLPQSPIAAFGFFPDTLASTHQILYRTADNVGNATATALTVMIPRDADLSKLIAFQVAEDAASVDCGPSFGFQAAAQSDPVLGSNTTQLQMLLVEGLLYEGWPVTVADFLGPKGAYGAVKLASHAILDGIRATLSASHITGIHPSPRIAMWGYSGGAGATQTAAELQPIYAPELNISGAAIGGLGPGGVGPEELATLDGSKDAGLLATALVGLSNQYPALRQLYDSHLKPRYHDTFYAPLHQCLEANLDTFRMRKVLDMFNDPKAMLTNPVIENVLKDNTRGYTTPRVPIFIYQCVHDEIAPITSIDAVVKGYCDKGVSVQYHRNTATNMTHVAYGIIGAPVALDWLREVMDGEGAKKGCSTTDDDVSNLEPSFVKILPKALGDSLLDLLKHYNGQ